MQANLQPFNNCGGIYLGKVILHLAHGLLKVYIHGVYPIEWLTKPELLPICMQITPLFAGSNNGNGVFSYPNIGSTVVCVFANGDLNMPLMLGSLLGGMNAFGQYEWIKRPDEPISDKHLLTAGKSHIEMYENGKISAVVYDPIRTDAEVLYNNIPNAELSIDAVVSRPLCDKVDAKEISNINCQLVLDNNVANGYISASTHYFNPINKLSTTYLSVELLTIIDSEKGDDTFDSYYSTNNAGLIEISLVKSYHSLSNYNVTNIPQKITELTIAPLTSESSVKRYLYIDGQEGCDMLSLNVDAYSYTYASEGKNILSTHNIKNEAKSSISLKLPGEFLMIGKHNNKITEMYSNSTTGDLKTFNAKQKLENSFYASKDASFTIETLSTNNSVRTDAIAQILPHLNKHNANAKIVLGSESGFYFNSSWKDDDIKNIAGTLIQVKEKNVATHDICIHPRVYSDLLIHHKLTKIVNNTPVERDVMCLTLMSPADGKFELKIVNKLNKQSCLISMDENGNMTIDATASLTIKAPVVNVIGETMTETFNQITTTASKLNIKGAQGDCKIKNVSLLNHVHQETLAGDVVSPLPTKSATASN